MQKLKEACLNVTSKGLTKAVFDVNESLQRMTICGSFMAANSNEGQHSLNKVVLWLSECPTNMHKYITMFTFCFNTTFRL